MQQHNDVYVRMLEDHPIQKEHRLHQGDRYYHQESHDDYIMLGLKPLPTNSFLIWLPTQEDWQEKYAKDNMLNQVNTLSAFIDYCVSWTSQELKDEVLEVDDITILWCLFVSKEVYGLDWDWEEDCWCQDREKELLGNI